MKLIKPKAQLLKQGNGLIGIHKQIELCGRTCYKSEDKIKEGGAKSFVEMLIRNGHLSMLEHGTVYLKIPVSDWDDVEDYQNNSYSHINIKQDYAYVTTNMRVLKEKKWDCDLDYLCEPTEFHEKRYTVKITTDRAVSHELVRHRVFSFAQESTRYCNYSKDKFGKELIFIIPSWLESSITDNDTFNYDEHINRWQSSEDPETSNFLQSIAFSEKSYLTLLQNGCTPQQARQVLPNATKTEIIMTGFASDWENFLNIRLLEHTGKVHPDMRNIAYQIFQQLPEDTFKTKNNEI